MARFLWPLTRRELLALAGSVPPDPDPDPDLPPEGDPFRWLYGAPVAPAAGIPTMDEGYRVSGNRILDPAGADFIPRGSNLGTNQYGNGGGWPYFALDSTYADDFKARGGNTVRLVMYASARRSWSPYVTGHGGNTGTAACVSAFSPFVDFWRGKGVVVIIECHDLTDSGWTQAQAEQCEDFMAAMADAYRADTGVWLNPYNEPNVYTSWDAQGGRAGNVTRVRERWTKLTARMCKRIRDAGSKSIIVTDTFGYAGDSGKQSDGQPAPRGFDPGAAPLLRDTYGGIVLSWHNYGHHNVLTNSVNIQAYITKVTGTDAGLGQAGLPLLIGELGYPIKKGWDSVSTGGPWESMVKAVDYTYTVAPGNGIGILNWASNFKDGFSLYKPFWDAPTSGQIINEFAETLPGSYSLSGQGAKHMAYLAAPTVNQPYTVSHDGGTSEQ